MITILSLGAGVQSSTLALMSVKGLIEPMPDCAIFADTGSEPDHTYEYLDYLEKLLPYPVHRVMKDEGLGKNIIDSIKGGLFAGVPFFTESNATRGGQLRRQCTLEFKITPIVKKTRELLGYKKGQRIPNGKQVIQYIGISTDEAARMKPSHHHYIEHRWPLIEKDMNRMACLKWLKDNNYKLPGKSACTFCPYHDDALWREMKMNDPKSFADAVKMDELIRGGVRGTKQKLYLHRSLKPLSEVDFRNTEDAGQARLFDEECEGMCGV